MTDIKNLLLGLVATGALALTLAVSPTPAHAQLGGGGECLQTVDGNGECARSCTDDFDCYAGEECNSGICREAYCGIYSHSDLGVTVAIFEQDPGDYVVLSNPPTTIKLYGDMNQSYSRFCSGATECGTNYKSYAKLNAGRCGGGQCDQGWEYHEPSGCASGSDCDTSMGWTDHREIVYHQHRVEEGKYRVRDTGKSCAYDGSVVVELVPCDC